MDKTVFLSGWELEVIYNGDKDCEYFFRTQAIEEKVANNLSPSLKVIFTDNKLFAVYEHEDGIWSKIDLKDDEIGMPYIDVVSNAVFEINKSKSSTSYLGGAHPDEFQVPKMDFIAPFQYLGMLSKKDEAFDWLPFDLHLTAPIYSNFDKLFLDYLNPNAPKVININDLKAAGTSFEKELNIDTEVIYEKTSILVQNKKRFEYGIVEGIGRAGVPGWIQQPEIPTCPKSGRMMKFVCQLGGNTGTGIKTVHTNVSSEGKYTMEYFKTMNFWSDGNLFIFFEPETRIACYFIQNT